MKWINLCLIKKRRADYGESSRSVPLFYLYGEVKERPSLPSLLQALLLHVYQVNYNRHAQFLKSI